MLRWLFIVESLLLAVIISIVMPIHLWGDIWIPIVIFVGSYFSLIILYLFMCWVISLFVNMKKQYNKQSKIINNFVILTMELINNLAHVYVKTSGFEKIPHNQKYMLVYNHTSNFDPMIQSALLRKDNVIHVSKPENFKIPIAGPMVHRNCYISLNRHNDREGLKSIMLAASYIRDQKFCVSISPEGTRNKGNVKELLPFRAGAFQMALMAKCPIVVVEMHNCEKIHKNFPFKRTNVEMNVLEVIPYEQLQGKHAMEISNHVREEIQNKINSRKEN